MRKETGSTKRFDALSIHSKMDDHEKIFRANLLNKIIDVNRPIFPDEIEDKNKRSIINSLSKKGLVVLREDGAITGVYPVSAGPNRPMMFLASTSALFVKIRMNNAG